MWVSALKVPCIADFAAKKGQNGHFEAKNTHLTPKMGAKMA